MLSKEYFVSTHSEGRFATLSNIFPLKPEGPIGLGNSGKSTEINILLLLTCDIINIFSISDSFLKTDSGNNYMNDKKKSVLDSTPSVLLEKFATFDDNKNNNRDQRSLSKEYLQLTKSMTLENDSNVTKNTNVHAYIQSGNSKSTKINIKLGFLINRIFC